MASEILIRHAIHADAEMMHDICVSSRRLASPDHHPITGEAYDSYEYFHQNWLAKSVATGLSRLHDYIEGYESNALIKCDPLLALVAEAEREVVGYALARFTVNYATEYCGTMLRSGFEGLGIGSMLEERRYKWADAIGETIFVRTASVQGHNFLARNGFYPMCGFRRWTDNPVHFMRFFKNPENLRTDKLHYNQIPLPDIPEPIRPAASFDDSKVHYDQCCLVL